MVLVTVSLPFSLVSLEASVLYNYIIFTDTSLSLLNESVVDPSGCVFLQGAVAIQKWRHSIISLTAVVQHPHTSKFRFDIC